jgi:ribosomal protein L15
MARVHKRRKSSRFRGSHTHGRGGKKKARGSGHRGGFGMAGSGKRGDQKKTQILKKGMEEYFGKRQTRMRFGSKRLKTLNLERLTMQPKEENWTEYKAVGELTHPLKLNITVGAASPVAIKSVEKHGGKLTVKNE